MGTNLRKLGVHGVNAPTIKSPTVRASDFNIGGIIGNFERKYKVAFEVNSPKQEQVIFGDFINSNSYAKDTTQLFWNNLGGQNATLWIKSHVGYTGTAYDAVNASVIVKDQNGIESAIAAANEIKTAMNAHAADATKHTTAIDNVNFPITTDSAQDLTTLLALINQIVIVYTAHEVDALKASAWAYHAAQESPSSALASTATVTTLAGAITVLADIKTKYNQHDANNTTHGGVAAHQLSLTATGTGANTLKFEAAYKEELEYGTSGNRTGVKIVNGIRFSTTLAVAMTTADTFAYLTSVSGVKVGDIITLKGTGATPGVIDRKILTIDETLKKITFASASAITGTIGDIVDVPGFKIKTYRKTITGLEQEIITSLSNSWCTMEPTVTNYYVENVHSENEYIKVSDQSSASTDLASFPDEISSITYLTSGADGTAATTAAHYSVDLTAFDNSDIRFICNPETTDIDIQKAIEVYCSNRTDTPIVIANIVENQTLSQYSVLGSKYQRSNDVFQVNVANWLLVSDPYNVSPTAPYRAVPNGGAVMGAWIQSIAKNGIHVIPCITSISLSSISGVENDNLGNLEDDDRTTLAEYGINIIQFVSGNGYMIRNFFTPSMDEATRFANSILMRNFVKVSAEDSLQSSENTPNSFNRIKQDADAILAFMDRLWDVGSTGNVQIGETFGQLQNIDETFTDRLDHYSVIADAINNPITSIQAGERNIDVTFTFPAPAGSIEISVGLKL